MSARLVWSRAFPYGAPLLMLRGGATRDPRVKAVMKRRRLVWDSLRHAWTTYMHEDEARELLAEIQAAAPDVAVEEKT